MGGGAKAQLGDTVDLAKTLVRVLRLCAAGYLSKGYGQFKQAALADPSVRAVRRCQRDLHGQGEPPEASGGVPGVAALETTEKAFSEVFKAPPKERGMGPDALSYEELGSLYHAHSSARRVLFALVRKINAGAVHEASVELLGESYLYGLEKPDKSTRPIGVGSAMRRMAGRCIYTQLKEEFAAVLTKSVPSAALLREAGFDADTPCNAPLQLGCGLAGGAEVLTSVVRLALELDPRWAVVSDDKRNGYNALSREAILAGVRDFFPELLPTVELWIAAKEGCSTVGGRARLVRWTRTGCRSTLARAARKGTRLAQSCGAWRTTGRCCASRLLTRTCSVRRTWTTRTTCSCQRRRWRRCVRASA